MGTPVPGMPSYSERTYPEEGLLTVCCYYNQRYTFCYNVLIHVPFKFHRWPRTDTMRRILNPSEDNRVCGYRSTHSTPANWYGKIGDLHIKLVFTDTPLYTLYKARPGPSGRQYGGHRQVNIMTFRVCYHFISYWWLFIDTTDMLHIVSRPAYCWVVLLANGLLGVSLHW